MKKICLSVFATMLISYSVNANELNVLSAVEKDTPIANAEIIFQKNGQSSNKIISNTQGKISFSNEIIDNSDTTMIIKKDGFSTLVAKCPCNGFTYALSPIMKNLDGLRIVLTWGENPSDLDSHLAYSNNHIFFNAKIGSNANLDVDDIDSYGPETITIEKKQLGTKYIYAVHNYTFLHQPNSNSLAKSNAKVNVYIGQTLVRTYNVNPNKIGNLWVVFSIDEDGIIHDINKYSGINSDSEHIKLLNESNFTVATYTEEDKAQAKKYNTKGEEEYHKGNLEQSMYLFLDAINLYSNYGQAYSNLGLVYQKLGRDAEALWANQKAIELASGNNKNIVQSSSYFNIGKIYENREDYENALKNYENALNKKQNDVYINAINRVKEKLK